MEESQGWRCEVGILTRTLILIIRVGDKMKASGFKIPRGMRVFSIVSEVEPFISSVVLKFSLFYIAT